MVFTVKYFSAVNSLVFSPRYFFLQLGIQSLLKFILAFICFRSPGHSQKSPKFSSSCPVCVSFLNVLNCRKVMLFFVVLSQCVVELELLTVAVGQSSSNGGHFFPPPTKWLFSHLQFGLSCIVCFNSELIKLHPGSVDCWGNPFILHFTIHSPPKAAGLTVFTFSLHS